MILICLLWTDGELGLAALLVLWARIGTSGADAATPAGRANNSWCDHLAKYNSTN
jgi:hypothetical protein